MSSSLLLFPRFLMLFVSTNLIVACCCLTHELIEENLWLLLVSNKPKTHNFVALRTLGAGVYMREKFFGVFFFFFCCGKLKSWTIIWRRIYFNILKCHSHLQSQATPTREKKTSTKKNFFSFSTVGGKIPSWSIFLFGNSAIIYFQ